MMNTNPIIFVFLFSIGIASDNLMLSAMSRHSASLIKNSKAILMLFLLLHIQITAFIYGSWLAKAVYPLLHNQEHWFAVMILSSTAIRLYRELMETKKEMRIVYGLDGFMGIACATFIYVFVLSLALGMLHINSTPAYLLSVLLLAVMLALGWYLGKLLKFRLIKIIKIIAIVFMSAGILALIFQIN